MRFLRRISCAASNLPAGHPELHHHQLPLTNGFFAGGLLHAIAYEQAEQDFPEAMQ
jgi:hypothetical protein